MLPGDREMKPMDRAKMTIIGGARFVAETRSDRTMMAVSEYILRFTLAILQHA